MNCASVRVRAWCPIGARMMGRYKRRNPSVWVVMEGGEPAVTQPTVNGHPMSWNPDDGRFYVHGADGEVMATFRDWRNAVRFARTH